MSRADSEKWGCMQSIGFLFGTLLDICIWYWSSALYRTRGCMIINKRPQFLDWSDDNNITTKKPVTCQTVDFVLTCLFPLLLSFFFYYKKINYFVYFLIFYILNIIFLWNFMYFFIWIVKSFKEKSNVLFL